MSSDINIVLLTNDPATYIVSTGWWGFLGRAELIATRQWGPLTGRRIALPSGLEIEFGIAPPSRASIDPPDPGTVRVIRDGQQIIHDPDGYCERSSLRPPNRNSGRGGTPRCTQIAPISLHSERAEQVSGNGSSALGSWVCRVHVVWWVRAFRMVCCGSVRCAVVAF